MMNENRQPVDSTTESAVDGFKAVGGAFAAFKPKDRGITALYSRLSREDTQSGQSVSITNQMEILENYAKGQGFTNIVHFCEMITLSLIQFNYPPTF